MLMDYNEVVPYDRYGFDNVGVVGGHSFCLGVLRVSTYLTLICIDLSPRLVSINGGLVGTPHLQLIRPVRRETRA